MLEKETLIFLREVEFNIETPPKPSSENKLMFLPKSRQSSCPFNTKLEIKILLLPFPGFGWLSYSVQKWSKVNAQSDSVWYLSPQALFLNSFSSVYALNVIFYIVHRFVITMQICNISAMFLFWLLIAINYLSFSLSVEAAHTRLNKCFYPVTGNIHYRQISFGLSEAVLHQMKALTKQFLSMILKAMQLGFFLFVCR